MDIDGVAGTIALYGLIALSASCAVLAACLAYKAEREARARSECLQGASVTHFSVGRVWGHASGKQYRIESASHRHDLVTVSCAGRNYQHTFADWRKLIIAHRLFLTPEEKKT